MANIKQAALIKESVKEWNKWRRKNPHIAVDLSFANFDECNFENANLSRANIMYTTCNQAWFHGANLELAQFDFSTLIDTNFTKAKLLNTRFSYANLFMANFENTDLLGTNLVCANLLLAKLSQASFNRTIIGGTSFASVDLSNVLALDMADHRSPSTVGIDTIYRSKGKIPEAFLRGCGVPPGFIEYMHDLVKAEEMGGQFFSCFICYSHFDESFAKKVQAFLLKHGVRVWIYCEDQKIGDKIRDTVYSKICTYDKVFPILSKNSVESEWVEYEVERAFEQEKLRNSSVLFPIMIDDTVMKTNKAWVAKVRDRHIGNFTSKDKHAASFERLLRDLRTLQAPP